jgi:YfiH family protein
MTVDAVPATVVREERISGEVPLWMNPLWQQRFPWLVQGTTGSGDPSQPFDLGLAGAQPVGPALDRWRALLRASGLAAGVHTRQVHGAELWLHQSACAPGLLVMDGRDGHLTACAGLLLSVGVADCVPVSLVAPEARVVALVHAGWRGTAAGIVERAAERLHDEWDVLPRELWLHCGPAICGSCYEVGPEVHAAIHPSRPAPPGNTPIDVRAAIAGRARALGIPAAQVSVSAHCTRCGPGDFFSHRGGSRARQMGVLGIRPE